MSLPEETSLTEAQLIAAETQISEQSKRIEFFITEYSVEFLAAKMHSGDFEIPGYQREDTWEDERKSRFIESLLMGLPVPFLFFWERPNTGKLEIVDGSQRLRTIHQFILGDFQLGELDVLAALEGMRFRDLTESRQRKFKNRSVRGIVLNEHADEQARFEIFDRINTGSKIANFAEVRRGALIGKFLDLVIELTKDELFMKLAPVSDRSVKLREREELITRFFAYGDGLTLPNGMDGYNDRPSPFLFAYAKRMNAQFEVHPEKVDQYKKRFTETMEFINRIFPHGFSRREGLAATPRSRFEAIAIGSYLAIHKDPSLNPNPNTVTEWLAGEDFSRIIRSDGANPIAKLKGRINYVRDKLVEGTK